MSKNCSHCGKPLEEDAKICLECGTLVDAQETDSKEKILTEIDKTEILKSDTPASDKPKSSQLIEWIQKNIIIVCLTILVLIGAIVYFNQNPLNGTWQAADQTVFPGELKIKGNKINYSLNDELDNIVVSGKINKDASKEYSVDLSETKIKGTFFDFFEEGETENDFYEELRVELKESGILTNKEINSFLKAIHKDGKNLKIDLNFSKFSKGAIGELWSMMLGSSSKVKIEKKSRNNIIVILQDTQIELIRQR